jgi:hypothetical protein
VDNVNILIIIIIIIIILILNTKGRMLVQKTENTAVEIRRADHTTPSIRKKLALTSLTSGGRSVGIVRLRTEAMGF